MEEDGGPRGTAGGNDSLRAANSAASGPQHHTDHELRITNIQDIDPPNFIAANRERAGFRAGLAAAMAVENAAEPELDPADLVPYRGRGGEPAVAIGKPVYGPYLGFAPHAVAGLASLPQCVIGQVVA